MPAPCSPVPPCSHLLRSDCPRRSDWSKCCATTLKRDCQLHGQVGAAAGGNARLPGRALARHAQGLVVIVCSQAADHFQVADFAIGPHHEPEAHRAIEGALALPGFKRGGLAVQVAAQGRRAAHRRGLEGWSGRHGRINHACASGIVRQLIGGNGLGFGSECPAGPRCFGIGQRIGRGRFSQHRGGFCRGIDGGLGCWRGNLRDSRMETLADKGNGNYAYLDNLDEAGRVLVAQFGGTLFTVAKDVKLQIEFNPARVASYRLVGYENRLLAAEDFNNDRKDAGELGAGHTVTALYEIVPAGSAQPLIDDLKYQPAQPTTATMQRFLTNDVLTVKLRHKEPQGSASKLLAQPLAGTALAIEKASPDFRFAAAVAQFGMLLRQSEQRGTATWAATEQLADGARGQDTDGYRAEFVRLVRLAQGLSGSGTVGVR